MNDDSLLRRVTAIAKRLDKDDAETVAEVQQSMLALAEELLPHRSMTDQECHQLERSVMKDKPSCTTRLLRRWQFQLPDRKVRKLEQLDHIQEFRWA